MGLIPANLFLIRLGVIYSTISEALHANAFMIALIEAVAIKVGAVYINLDRLLISSELLHIDL